MAITLRAPNLVRACVALGGALACALPAAPVLAECLGMKIHAHRGSADSPENSASALRSAYAGNWDGVEIDMQQLADGTWVLHHDLTTGRAVLTGGSLPVAKLTPADWQRARMTLHGRATDEAPPFLADAAAIAAAYPGKTFNAEVKEVVGNCQPVQALVAQLHQAIPHGNWFLTSGLRTPLRCARGADREGYLGLIVFDGRNAEAAASNRWTRLVAQRAHSPRLTRTWMQDLVAELGKPVGVHVDAKTMDANPMLLDDAAATGLSVFAYAVDGDVALASAIGRAHARTNRLPSGAIIDGHADSFCAQVRQAAHLL
ncbi:glycerophosphodiester phosphodiesterase [Ralstonia pickettii]|uniref:Glycerophosphodiester phosphodiesterase n=1 Tax=Ralstonia pickettii TaxID=329 RepID=A0A7X2LA66_RALPI|nr:glycerophosphodiester phosphodiesterase [Ralstonia pickettii]MRS99678.1 glycerophosphodiester phosphodiesterase [Ralstonia pickettii]